MKLTLFLLDLLRPFFFLWKKRKREFFARLRQRLTDPYFCGMVTRFNFLHELIFKPYFDRVRVDPAELTQLKELSQKGTLVYVMRHRGQLEYSFFNHRFLKEEIPLARFANGARTLFWRPLGEIVRLLLARLDRYYDEGLIADPIRSGYLEETVTCGGSALLHLKVSRELLFGTSDESLRFIPPLLKGTERSERPIFLVTQQFLYDRRPEKADKSFFDLLFGEKSNPGTFRKLILFVLSYRRRASVKFGEAINLNAFAAENAGADATETAAKLKSLLLSRLAIERKSITGPPLQTREKLLEKMLRSTTFKEELEAIAHETGRSRDYLEREGKRIFDEIAASVNYSYIDFYDRVIRWLVHNIYDGLEIDHDAISRIKAVAGRHPVVLVPSHKSHIDYLLLSYIFYNADLTLPHVCAGINLNFWPAARFIRRGGGFFIRRSFSGNRLYKVVLQEYLNSLLSEGHSIEFFIEGTRSRTGKLLKPRMGFLSMIANTFFEGLVGDIYLVPISINYERVLEQNVYVDEIHGAEKQKENVTGLVGSWKKFRKKYGKVSIRFADPISMKDWFTQKGIAPQKQHPEEYREEINDLAYRITYDMNRVALVTATSLAATALLSHPGKGTPEVELLHRVEMLKKYLTFKGATFSGALQQRSKWALLDAIQRLANERLVTPHRDFWERFYTVDPPRRMILDYHKNNSVHFFVSLVCFSKILSMEREGTLSLDTVIRSYDSLKRLLHNEFTFSERASLEEHLFRVIRFYVQEGIVHYDEEKRVIVFRSLKGREDLSLYASLLDNFFESLYLTLLYLKHVDFLRIDEKTLMASILERGSVLFLKGILHYPEALSQFNVSNALTAFEEMGLIRREGKKLLSRIYDEDSIARWESLLADLLGLGPQKLTSLPAPDDSPKPSLSSSLTDIH